MENNSKKPNHSISKVTLSCRVTPEQKLLIARQAKENGMSLAEYAEAKILMDDDLILRLDFEKIKMQKEYMAKELKVQHQLKKDVEEYFGEIQMYDFYSYYGYMKEVLDED